MTSEQHYKSNLRDIQFNLFEVLQIDRHTLDKGPFAGVDRDTVEHALGALAELCEHELAASFVEGDRTPLVRDDAGNVRLPEGVKKSLRAFWDGGWHLLELPQHLGGMGVPATVRWAGFELVAGANGAACFYFFGATVASVIDTLGTEAQKKRYVRAMLDAPWGGSMALTEADAGSDVGAGRTTARHIEGDVWELQGTKRFITNGDFDAVDNIVHLVLARPEGAAAGTKGLSMFIVPKIWVHADGSLGERNGVFCANIEKKMGIKASATCELVLGGDRPARGLLVGEVHDGIRQMFQLIEQARMAVGIKSMATLSTAYLNALEYTKQRVQGSDMKRMTDKEAPRVPIINHPDVRRMLMAQKSHAEGMRALCLYAASVQDEVARLGGHNSPAARDAERLNDLLLPLVKGYCSEKAYEMLALSLQCFGGSGYCQDYPIEQYIRDQKIDSLYEGTTHIQSLDLLFRKVARDGGETLQSLMARIAATAQSTVGGEALAPMHQALGRALADVQGIFGAMLTKMNDSIYHAGLQANRILMAVAELVIGWLWVRQAEVAFTARASPAGPSDARAFDSPAGTARAFDSPAGTARASDASPAGTARAFYSGKLAAAHYWCATVLPALTLARKLVEASELSLTQLPEEAF